MSTVSRRVRRRPTWGRPVAGSRNTSRRRALPLVLCAGALVLLVWFAPALFVHTGLLNRVVRMATADMPGTVSLRTASLGWFSSIGLYGLTVHDAEGALVVDVPAVTIDRSLVGLIRDASRLGTIRIDRPQLNLVLRDDGSNLEDLLAPWMTAEEEEPDTDWDPDSLPTLAVELVDASLSIRKGERDWRLERLRADVVLPASKVEPMTVASSGSLSGGTFSLDLAVPLATQPGPAEASVATCRVKTDTLPLDVAEAFLRRVVPDVTLAGHLTSEVAGQWSGGLAEPADAEVQGHIVAQQLHFAGPWLGDDQLRLARLEVPCQGTWQGNRIEIERLAADCDVGSASFEGTIDLTDGVLASLTGETYEVQADVDLARLAALLPQTIRVRDDMHITAGSIKLRLASAAIEGGLAWQGHVETSNLVGTAAGKQVTWEQPVLVKLAARRDASGPVIDDLYCEASFLELQASGAADFLSASASYDLDQLATELSRFVDLGDLRLAGSGWAHLMWRRRLDGRFEADAEFEVASFEMTMPPSHPWIEEKLQMELAATGRGEWNQLERIDTAELRVISGADHMQAKLARPVEELTALAGAPVEIELNGALEKWVPRIEPWAGPLEGWDLAGQCQFTAAGAYNDGTLDVERSWMRVRPFSLRGAAVAIDEPELVVQTAMQYDTASGRMQLHRASLATHALSLQTPHVEVALPEEGDLVASGTITYSGDIARLSRWIEDPAAPSEYRLGGRLQGQLEFRQQQSSLAAHVQTTVNDLTADFSSGTSWREPRVQLNARCVYTPDEDLLKLDELALAADSVGCNATGKLAALSGQRHLELVGQLNYDLDKLRPLIEPYTGPEVQISGRGTKPFSIRGPLVPTAGVPGAPTPAAPPAPWIEHLAAESAIGWSWINAYGFQVGPGQIDGRLDGGQLLIAPLNLPMSGGRLQFGPRVRLSPEPMLLTHGQARVVDGVTITPEMCNQALQYIAPALAGVTRAQGRFSIDLDGAHVPIDDPTKSDLGGRLVVHSVEVGPGPLVEELAVLLNRPGSARLTRESSVTFRMVEGRVYHRDLELVFPELTIRTYGSVGVTDRTLAIMAEMPVPPKWIGNNPLGDALRNQTIRLPIGGTLDNPQIDRQVLSQLSAEFIQRAAGDALRNQLNRGLDRLLRPN